MTTENDVAAQAGDEQANFDDQIAKIMPTQLDTWRAEVARLNDLIAHASGVQAGDEPMLTDDQVGNGVRAFVNAGKRGEDLGGAIRAAIVEALACRVSPRATADVERDALYFAQQIVRTHINLDSWMRQDHACNECVPGQKSVKEGFQCFYHRAKSFIATTKPGA